MELWQAIILAILQGLTEFLPISSSAHLILPSQLLGWPDQGLAFDVAVHVGTLLAVMSYFRKDIVNITKGFIDSTFLGKPNMDGKLAWCIVLATIPAGIVGICLNGSVEEYLRNSLVIATTTTVFGVLLWYADRKPDLTKTLSQISFKQAVIIGCAQALALIPGTSRSGITITAAMLMGFDRQSAARFSFLLSIPLILLAGSYKAYELLTSTLPIPWSLIFIGALVSCISAYVCIYLFLKLIEQLSMTPFVIYRLILGAFLFIGVFLGWFV
ncbi:undecaprenyl-diphosphate phosphatase [Oceaniserpentilla sp. 4NH20-0058]|uniref:undecaprenyl-diphosphate phosphatase n=1 Tax=Oceaniserpentilla sp. 4NH20-0058 TaxID=3127660 RepID=UPI00310C115C